MRIAGVDWWLDVRYRERAFSGKVAIRVEGVSGSLTVDAARLEIVSAMLDGQPVPCREDPAKGTIEFSGVSPEHHLLEIAYHGAADPNSLVGLYVAPCGSGYCLTTMLFPSGSRRLLPSFEDPTVKTVYRLVLTTDADMKAIFNTPSISERRFNGRRAVTFAPTPPMSAYLLYLGVGPFDTITVPGNPWSVTVAASPGRASAGQYSAERASEILAAYEEYYGVSYPLPKLDLVALENFWAGAMENWGAIAFRESDVLVDPTTTTRERRVNLLVLAHEIAHQWFGNLVTPAHWDDFWLSESFATFVGHRIVGQRYPEENPWTYFLNRYTGRALDEDARSATHPVKVPVSSPDELGEIADDVTYGKGAAVLRMIESYLGEDTFRRGVSRYLDRFRYSNARAEDLWGALAEVSDRPVDRVMTAWITRPGYPVVHAQWSNGTLTLRQERFRADGTPSPGLWPIPLRVSSPSGDHSALFETPIWELPLRSPERLRINPERTAFARVHYDEGLFDQILNDFSHLSPIDQWGVVVDAHAFVYAGMLPLSRFLRLVRTSSAVTHELVVPAVVLALRELNLALHDVPKFHRAACECLRAQLTQVGVDRRPGEADSVRLVREFLSGALALMDPDFAVELSPRFREFDRVPTELRSAVALAYASAEGSDAFDPLVTRLRSTVSDNERTQLLRGLSGFRDPSLLRRALELIPSPGVTPSGALDLFVGLSANPASGGPLFQWYQDRSEALSRMLAGTPMLGLLLRLTLPVMGLDQEEPVERYFRDHTPPEAKMAVALALETLHLWTRLRRRSLSD